MRRHRLALAIAAVIAALTFAQPARANVMIIIDKAAQKMTVTVDGEDRYTWPVSTGRPGYDTPSGEFQPFRMERDHFSREWDDAPMPNSIFFTKIGHAIHGTFEARNLGRPASHGCVRLSTENAATLFSLVKAEGVFNTRVKLTGETPKLEEPVARRKRDNDRDASRSNRSVREAARNTDRDAAHNNDQDTARSRDRNTARSRDYVRNYTADDDKPDPQPSTTGRQPRGARDNQDYSRSYYNYRERPNYENRSYGRGIFTSGW
jgi:hypothetical protein